MIKLIYDKLSNLTADIRFTKQALSWIKHCYTYRCSKNGSPPLQHLRR